MTDEKIREIVMQFAAEARKIYGNTLRDVFLYGSCARGDFRQDSDIDLMILLDVPEKNINSERKKILEISDYLDRSYDVVLTPVFQSYQQFHKYMPVSAFYQNVLREGIKYA